MLPANPPLVLVLEILNRNADALNREARDVLAYQMSQLADDNHACFFEAADE